MKSYPVLLNVHDPVIGNGFVAVVRLEGRALMKEEDGGFWIDGVYPGAIAAGGSTRDDALLRFRESYRNVLFDLASVATSFTGFKNEVERFCHEATPGEAEAWLGAATALRQDRSLAGDWLPVTSSYTEPRVTVQLLRSEDLEPQKNAHEQAVLASAA